MRRDAPSATSPPPHGGGSFPAPPRRSRRRTVAVTGFALLVILALAAMTFVYLPAAKGAKRHPRGRHPQPPPRRIATEPQKHNTGQLKTAHRPRKGVHEKHIHGVPQHAEHVQHAEHAEHAQHAESGGRRAHVVVIGNQLYVDGALAMGWSLHKHSEGMKRGTVDAICICTAGEVSRAAQARLKQAGWTRVLEVPSLAHRVKKAHWKDSFVKLHIFNLTEYSMVAYWDSDMLVLRNPDTVFDAVHVAPGEVGAIGNHATKDREAYFQTGMMVFRPTDELRDGVWGLFDRESLPRNKHGRFNTLNSRDGMLLREYFGGRFRMLSNSFSSHTDPRRRIGQKVVALHFRGRWKPWYDRRKPFVKKNRLDDGSKDFGYPYFAWWEAYEEMHEALWGGHEVHMLQGTPDEYHQPLRRVWEEQRRSIPVARRVIGGAGESCDDACLPSSCDVKGFESLTLASFCRNTTAYPQCKKCYPGIYTKRLPGSVYPAISTSPNSTSGEGCYENLLLDERSLPTCSDKAPGVRRVCPCTA